MATEDLNLQSDFAKCMKLEEVLERTWPAIGVELLRGVVIIIIDLIICYTNDNNPRLSTNATSRPYGRTTKEKAE